MVSNPDAFDLIRSSGEGRRAEPCRSLGWRLGALITTFLAGSAAAVAYECARQLFIRPLTLWPSHAITVIMFGISSATAGWLARGNRWYLTEITESRRTERALRESEARFQRLCGSNIIGVFIVESTGKILESNGVYLQTVGYTQDDIRAGQVRWDRMMPLEYRDVSERIFQQLRTSGVSAPLEMEFIRKDGSRVPILVALASLDQQALQSIGVLLDLSDRKRSEAENARLVTAIEQSAEAVVVTDLRGAIEYVNPAFTRITGYDREEVLGQNPRILKSGKQDSAFYQQLWATILAGATWRGEMINQRKNGKLYTAQMSVTPVRNPRGEVTHFIATKLDVTEQKTLETQLQQAAKMEAIGHLAGGVAHDFNNLLTVINGYAEILLETVPPGDMMGSALKEIKGAGERAASLTRQLLAFSRRQVLDLQVLNVNAVVSGLEEMLRRLIGEDIKLRTVLQPSLARVKGDPGQIEQVIINLAVNARDAMPRGGSLTIETSIVELDEAYAQSHVTVKSGPHVLLAITDTGVGMSPETKARIFEPFFTSKEMGKGTGLGLATVYGIVKQSGGSVWVYSELGQGTVFKIYLPALTEVPAATAPVKPDANANFGSETILVVEDEEEVRSLIRMALESSGYNILATEDPENVAEMCASYSGPIDLLLTDVVLPKLSGRVVAENVTRLRPNVKVLYMSGYTADAIVHHGGLTEGLPFIQKPFSPTVLRKKIREALVP